MPTNRPADTVARLVDRSLVLATPSPDGVRFVALETVRSYGVEQLRATGSYDDARRRHAGWFVAATTEIDDALRRRTSRPRCDRFDEVVDEVRAAVRWTLDHDVDLAARLAEHAYTAGRSQLRAEVVSWLEDVARRLPVDHPMRPRIRSALVGGLAFVGRLAEAKAIGAEVLASGAGDAALMYALEGLGDIATYEGRLDDSLAFLARLRRAAAERDDSLYADLATVGLAIGDGYAGRTDATLATLDADRRAGHRPRPPGSSTSRGRSSAISTQPSRSATWTVPTATARVAGNRFLVEVTSLAATTLRARSGRSTRPRPASSCCSTRSGRAEIRRTS